MEEAAFGDPESGIAWTEYHDYIDDAKRAVGGKTLYIDVHGQVKIEISSYCCFFPSVYTETKARTSKYWFQFFIHSDPNTRVERKQCAVAFTILTECDS